MKTRANTLLVWCAVCLFNSVFCVYADERPAESATAATLDSSSGFDQAFTFQLKRDGELKSIPFKDTKHHPVDLYEILHINVDKSILTQYEQEGLSDKMADIEAQMARLQTVIDAVKQSTDLAVRIGEFEVTAGNQSEFIGLGNQYEAQRKAIRDNYSEFLKQSMGPSAARKHLSQLMKQDPHHGATVREASSHLERLSTQMNQVFGQSYLRLRLRATLYKPQQNPIAVSVENYDSGECNQPRFDEKLSFTQSPERQKQIDESVQLASKISDDLKAVNKNSGQLHDLIKEVYRELVQQGFDLPDYDKLLGDLKENAKTLQETVKSAPNNVKAEINTLIQSIENLATALRNVKGIFDNLKSLNKSKSEEELLRNVNQLVSMGFKGTIGSEFVDSVLVSLQAVRDSADRLKTLTADLSKDIKNPISAINTNIDQFINETQKLWDQMARLAKLEKMTNATKLGAVADTPFDVFSVPLHQAQNTSIDMTCVQGAEEGDVLGVTAELVKSNPETDTETEISKTHSNLSLAKLGWSTHVSGDLIFIRREDEDVFTTAPALSYVYRYRPWSETGGGQRFLSVLNPGLGLNFATLSFDQSDIQVGVGVTLSLFRDLIRVGYGYNLQVDERPEYFFVGFNFTEIIARLNKRAIPQ